MATENRMHSFWLGNLNTPDQRDPLSEEKPLDYFKEVVRGVRAHAKDLERQGISPQVISAAVHEYVLKHASCFPVTRIHKPPYTVSISYGERSSVVYRQPHENMLTDLNRTVDAYLVYGMVMLMQVEEHLHQLSESTKKMREVFVSKEEKCLKSMRKFAIEKARTSSFEELLDEVTQRLAEECPQAEIETNKYNDIIVTINGQKVKIFTNHSYPYQDQAEL